MALCRPLRRSDFAIAAGLALLTFVGLAATTDIGFTRDETFYFKFASVYQDWFSRIQDTTDNPRDSALRDSALRDSALRDSALARADTVTTWSENFEHPPLAKVLFGLSWRLFGDKRRPLSHVIATPDGTTGRLTHLREAEGFQVGDVLTLYAPLPVQGDRSDQGRLLGSAIVTERTPHAASLLIRDLSAADLTARCAATDTPWIHGCQASSSGPLQVLSESSAMRLPAWVFAALLVALLYLFGTELFGPWAGLFAALSFILVPRTFFHAHLAVFDIPVTTLIVATVWFFHRSVTSPRWVIPTALIWGIALLTKLNAFFIPIPLVATWLLTPLIERAPAWRPTWPKLTSQRLIRAAAALALSLAIGLLTGPVLGVATLLLCLTAAGLRLPVPPLPKAFLWMPPIGLTMLFCFWPRLWYDPATAFYNYINFHLTHVHYLQQYFGVILSAPPFPVAFPFVMTLLTVPIAILATTAVGLLTLLWWERAQTTTWTKLLLLSNALFPIALIALPNTPIFGGVKHWFATVAFGCLIAGQGFDWLRRQLLAWLRRPALGHAATAALLALLLATPAWSSLRYHRVGTSYYNSVAGGLRGAADRRMHRQFWGYAGRFALEYLNHNAPPNATVAFHNTTWDAMDWYKRDGLLREDIGWRRNPTAPCRKGVGSRGGGFYLFHHQESFAQDLIEAWAILKTRAPERVWSIDGVPVLSLYRCPDTPRRPVQAARSTTPTPATTRRHPHTGLDRPHGQRSSPE